MMMNDTKTRPSFRITSYHAAVGDNGFAFCAEVLPFGCFIALRCMVHPLRSIPITGISTLLRDDPPLWSALVLNALRGLPA